MFDERIFCSHSLHHNFFFHLCNDSAIAYTLVAEEIGEAKKG
jgi:hypothetical protein